MYFKVREIPFFDTNCGLDNGLFVSQKVMKVQNKKGCKIYAKTKQKSCSFLGLAVQS